MNAILQVTRFIYQNNPWYELPWRFLSAFYYQCRKRMSGNIVVKNLFNGKKIFLFPGNPISSALIYSAIPDKDEVTLLRKFADSNTIFLDIGANIGSYSLMLLDKVKTVYAFEAHPITAKCCKMNFLLNNIHESHVLEVAISDNNSQKLFSNTPEACPVNSIVQSSENAITVKAMTLDQFIQEKAFAEDISFILKIDVEGFEHEVFNGAKTFLKNNRVKAIIFETFSSQMPQVLSLLHELGFSTQKIGGNNMLAIRDKYATSI